MTSNAITQQWSDIFFRPADQHYDSMDDLLSVAEEAMNQSREIKAPSKKISFTHGDDDGLSIVIEGHKAIPMAQFALTQTAGMSKIQVQMLERLHKLQRNDLIVDNLNTLFPRTSDIRQVLVRDTFDPDIGLLGSEARAVNGSAYSRLWDFEVFEEADDWLTPNNFTPKIPKLRRIGAVRNQLMWNLQSALFRGDQCSFGFFFSDKDMSEKSNHLGGMQPGVMVWNSEVGARSFGFHTFYYHEQSGSIIVWTPSNHKRKRFVHRGDIRVGFREYMKTLEDVAEKYEERYQHDMDVFTIAASTSFAGDDDAAIQKLREMFKLSAPLSKAVVAASRLPQNIYGDDLSVWRIALGIAHEAGHTGRAESLVDETLVATNLIKRVMANIVK